MSGCTFSARISRRGRRGNIAMPPKHKTKRWSDLDQQGPTVRALCLGINEYQHLRTLDNCERDAEALAEKVRALPGDCTAKVCKSSQLKDKDAMRTQVRKFVQTIDKDRPPRVVLVSYSGHAMQDGDAIFMVPSGAETPKDGEGLKRECFSHNELFEILHEEMHKQTLVRSCCPCRLHESVLNNRNVTCDIPVIFCM